MKFSSRVEVAKPIKLIGIMSFILIIWLWYSYRYTQVTLPGDSKNTEGGQQMEEPVPATKPPDPRLVVDVYYECLCPDSRYFVLNELLPAFEKVGSLMTLNLWPYGKASTEKTEQGYSFQCQHGETECEGNMYHACAVQKIKEPSDRLNIIKCMINDNFHPEESARKCASQLSVDFESIHSCAIGAEGEELHYKAGVKTESLSPQVSFIPTIEIDGSQHSQKAILKDFTKEVCRIYTDKYLQPGQKIAKCP